MTALISATDLTMFRGEHCLFTKRQFALNAGELLLIEGANGSGKTSLLRGIAGLLDFETGCVNWNGRPTVEDGQAFQS